jgi:hypothetical protein
MQGRIIGPQQREQAEQAIAAAQEDLPLAAVMDCVTAFYAKCYRSVFDKRCMIGRSRGIDLTYA